MVMAYIQLMYMHPVAVVYTVCELLYKLGENSDSQNLSKGLFAIANKPLYCYVYWIFHL